MIQTITFNKLLFILKLFSTLLISSIISLYSNDNLALSGIYSACSQHIFPLVSSSLSRAPPIFKLIKYQKVEFNYLVT